jgi:phage terminase large subunit
VERVGEGLFFDLHVPVANHYFAGGVINHNTGKTYPCLQKVDAMCWKYPDTRALMVRKVYNDIKNSAVVTYEKNVLGALGEERETWHPDATPVRKHGGENVEHYDYPNGSRLVVGGLDKAGKVLSAEYDVIFVNQAEELDLGDWETLTTRATGRAGNMPYAQVLGDCNPSHPQHWILKRSREGPLALYESRHEDNPTLFDPDTGKMTKQGEETMRRLESLTGIRKDRLKDGLWVQAEGMIFDEWDKRTHILSRNSTRHGLTGDPDDPPPDDWRRIRVIDFGYTNPFVCQWWAIDGDGRMFKYREIYMSGRTVTKHVQGTDRFDGIRTLSEGEDIEATVCDHDAEDQATLEENGIDTTNAYKAVTPGIEAVKERLDEAGDGRSRLFVLEGSLVERDQTLMEHNKPTCTEEEIPAYVWKDSAAEDKPVKNNDHGCDCMRYAVAYVNDLGSSSTGSIF